jgi:cyanophycinase
MIARHRCPAAVLIAVALIGATVAVTPALAETQVGQQGTTLVPIGGGYEADTEQQLMRTVEQTASGPTIDILVVPSSYGDAPEDREANLRLAQQRTDELDANCEAVIDQRRFTGCTATLLVLLNRADALDPANSAAFDDPRVDLGFVLGGDQVLAMQVLANSPAEAAMGRAHARGMVISGTSAGNAIESRTMITGYTDAGQPWTGLQKESVTVGWGDDLTSDDRGLAFGSQRVIFDQHFYQRGRFGRLLNNTAQTVDRYGRAGKVGLGTDYATAPVLRDDREVTGMIGESSATIFNFDTATRPRWVGADATLSTRNVLTHLIAPDTATSYDVVHRTVSIAGNQVSTPQPKTLPTLHIPGRATVLLGGGGNDTASSAVLRSFVKAANGSWVVVVAAGYADDAAAQRAADRYRSALAGAGWTGAVTVLVQGRDRVDAAAVRGAAGVLFAGGDQSLIGAAVDDSGFADAVRSSVQTLPAVLTDGAMTAAMARTFDAVADPTSSNYEDEAIRYFRTDAQQIRRGLDIVGGASLEPWLTYNYRWGLVFGASATSHAVALGVSEETAIRVVHNVSTVVGDRSVVSVDGRQARFGTAPNGALTAVNTYVSTFAAGDDLG